MTIDFGKRFGFGGLRLPLLDPKDQMSIDYETLDKMVDKFMAQATTILILHISITASSRKPPSASHW